MKKELYKNMSICPGKDESFYLPDEEFVAENSEFQNILKEIFAVDEHSGLPRGDIAYYLSPEGNPQVKQWLMSNLLSARGGSVGSSVDGVSDDMLEEFSRQPNESLNSYRERIYSFGVEAKKYLDSLKPKDE